MLCYSFRYPKLSVRMSGNSQFIQYAIVISQLISGKAINKLNLDAECFNFVHGELLINYVVIWGLTTFHVRHDFVNSNFNRKRTF